MSSILTCRCVSHQLTDARKRRRSAPNDPTGTLPLQRRWKKDLDARWAVIKRLTKVAVSRFDEPVNMIAHSALTGQSPVHAFGAWIDEAMHQVVLHRTGVWILGYVRQAGDAGLQHARRSAEASGSGNALHPSADRIQVLQSLAVDELQGIADAVSQQATRVFALGLMRKRTPAQLVNDINRIIDSVGVRRGQLWVSFFTVKAFNTSALDGFRSLGVHRVGTVPERLGRARATKDAKLTEQEKAERAQRKLEREFGEGLVGVFTAGDDDVCEECQDISDDGPYDLDEAESLIPAHPNCRCAFVPADEMENS